MKWKRNRLFIKNYPEGIHHKTINFNCVLQIFKQTLWKIWLKTQIAFVCQNKFALNFLPQASNRHTHILSMVNTVHVEPQAIILIAFLCFKFSKQLK